MVPTVLSHSVRKTAKSYIISLEHSPLNQFLINILSKNKTVSHLPATTSMRYETLHLRAERISFPSKFVSTFVHIDLQRT